MPERQELLQAGGGLQGGVQEHVGAGGARAGFERGQAGDHAHRAGGPVQHRVRHPGDRGGVPRHPLGRRDLPRRHAPTRPRSTSARP
jgi:hypothetical protein